MILTAVLLFAQLGVAEAAACDDPQTQSAMNACAAKDYTRAEDALDAQWSEIRALATQIDEALDREYDRQPGYLETLEQAQRAWLDYRDAHCLADSFLARGGSMQPMLYAHCRKYLTQQRTFELSELTHSLMQ